MSYGSIFTGIGAMVLLLVFSHLCWQISKLYKSIMENMIRQYVLEDILLDRVCKKKGINLEKEMMKRDFLRERTKSMHRKIKQEMYEELFGKEDNKDESD